MTLASLLISAGIGAFALIEEPAKEPPVRITGTVLDTDRRPAPGAGVFFSTFRAGGGWPRVVARAETDPQGRFRLEVPGAPGGGPRAGILWAYRPGALVATYRVTRETLPPDWPLAMVLDEPARAEFVIRGPDGRPVVGARIQPRVIHRDVHAVPDGLAERIEAEAITDEHGRAVVRAFFPEEIATVFVAAPGLGRQYFGLWSRYGRQDARTLTLRPVGRIEGHVIASEPGIGRDCRLSVAVWDHSPGAPVVGMFEVTTDPQGRFALPKVPVGELHILGVPPAGSPWFLQMAAGARIEAGRTTRVEVKAIRGVRIKGTVRQRATGTPIAGARVHYYGSAGSDDATVRTDAEGRFTLFAQAGDTLFLMVFPPEGFASPVYGQDLPKVPEGAAEFDLPPLELTRSGAVRGIAVDDGGQPVPGAEVLASWRVDEGPALVGRQERHAIADRKGEFFIEGVNNGAIVDLYAVAPDGRRTIRLVRSRAGAGPARLVLESSGLVSLAGRVVDRSGHRIAGAKVHIRTRQLYPDGGFRDNVPVAIRGAYVIRTNDAGWYRTPTILDPEGLYTAMVEADGYEPARTSLTSGKARTFPEIVLRPRAEAPARSPDVSSNSGSSATNPTRPVRDPMNERNP